MRTEKEMLNLILNIAKQDKNIKGVMEAVIAVK